MKKFILIILCFYSTELFASHIVGGEFELLHISGNTYRLNLIVYFDKINGFPEAKDPNATVFIFQKSDDSLISRVVLVQGSESHISYIKPECANGILDTDKLIYTGELVLRPEIFNEEEGYYIAWERCCRNYSISNIFSQNPATGGIAAGQTFYLEFPPVVKNGKAFINSSPRFSPILSNFACPNRPYYLDFSGFDDDGDSLTYTLVTPFNTHTQEAIPVIEPRPYPPVIWRPGFSDTNIINGLPDLTISSDGKLRATPQTLGLFVFAVQIREYRNKELIGITRRDFQMLVVDGCEPAVPPTITGPTSATLTSFDVGADRCITVTVSDDDSLVEPGHNFIENVRIRAVGLNFNNKNISEIFPNEVTATLVNGSTKDFTVCFPDCPFLLGRPAEIGIIAMDDACSLSLLDTLKISVGIEPPPNADPRFTIPDPIASPSPIFRNVSEGSSVDFPITAVDDDGDVLSFSIVADGFVLEDAGLVFTETGNVPGQAEGVLRWVVNCDRYDFTQQTSFQVKILVNDLDKCDLNDSAELIYNFTVTDLPKNNPPTIDTDLTPGLSEQFVSNVQRKIFTNLQFDVTGTDSDNSLLSLKAIGSDSLNAIGAEGLKKYGILFTDKEGIGTVRSQLNWDIQCEHIDITRFDAIDIRFMVIDDAGKCQYVYTDTVSVELTVLPPDNIKPTMVINSLTDSILLINNKLSAIRGNQIVLGLQGSDIDTSPRDSIRIELIEATGTVAPRGFVFEPAEGIGSVTTTFSWNPDCSIYENGLYENDYTFTFAVNNERCFNIKADTISIDMTIKDIVSDDSGFVPINFFSPNGDHVNDYYSMEKLNKTGQLENILPLDNCTTQFQAIRVYNRWGKMVFESTDRNFRWFGENKSAGVYYYWIKYSNKEYKGDLSIRY